MTEQISEFSQRQFFVLSQQITYFFKKQPFTLLKINNSTKSKKILYQNKRNFYISPSGNERSPRSSPPSLSRLSISIYNYTNSNQTDDKHLAQHSYCEQRLYNRQMQTGRIYACSTLCVQMILMFNLKFNQIKC